MRRAGLAGAKTMRPANVTNSVAGWPGYVGGVVGFRHEIREQRRVAAEILLVQAVAVTHEQRAIASRSSRRWTRSSSAVKASVIAGDLRVWGFS